MSEKNLNRKTPFVYEGILVGDYISRVVCSRGFIGFIVMIALIALSLASMP